MTGKRDPLALLYLLLRRFALFVFALGLQFHPQYLLQKLLKGSALVTVNGHKMLLDLVNDSGISKDLFIFRKREHLSTDFLIRENIFKKGDVVLDVGANIGYYALLESSRVGEEGKVYAIEPVQRNFDMLRKNIELNSISNIRAYRLAAGREVGEQEIFIAAKGNVSSFINHQGETYVGTETISVVRLDDFVVEHNIQPSLVRMDVEGFEAEIIAGMPQLLKKRPKLLIEVHPHIMSQDKLQNMFETIAEAGYSQAVVIKERSRLWMKRNGEVHSVLLFFSRLVERDGKTVGIGNIQRLSLEELRSTLSTRGSAFHTLLS